MAGAPPPPALDPEHLTDVLRRAGVLGGGRVSRVEIETARDTLVSRIARARLAYDGAADGAPDRLFLKSARVDGPIPAVEAGRKEVEFYERVAPASPPDLVPRCFEAVWEPEAKRWHILLEDLAESHMIVGEWPLPPTVEQCERIVETYARFHAHWWDDARLGGSIGTFLDGQAEAMVSEFPARLARFADRLGDRFSPERRRLYERFVAAAPRLLDRYRTHRDLTIVNGDSHVWNLFYPRESSRTDVRLIDWSGWRVDTATDDLAYMMAVHWYPERRRRLERPLLDRYHAALVAHGVRGYDRAALAEDYRLSVLWQLTTPEWQADHHLPAVIWWSHLERIVAAVDDLGCRDLLD
jgi:Ecdysteroid kinase-like family